MKKEFISHRVMVFLLGCFAFGIVLVLMTMFGSGSLSCKKLDKQKNIPEESEAISFPEYTPAK